MENIHRKINFIRILLMIMRNFYCRVFKSPSMGLLPPKGKRLNYTHYLAVHVRVLNEGPYLDEWIRFHINNGVDHIYIYDNNSSDNSTDILEKYIKAGLVTRYEWKQKPISPSAELHCIQNHGHECRWIAFIDADEFLYSPSNLSINEVLRDYESFAGVAVNWYNFGTSNHVRKPVGLVTENFTLRAETVNDHVKTIVDPSWALYPPNSHYWIYKTFRTSRDCNKRRVFGTHNPMSKSTNLRINHYIHKSEEEYLLKAEKAKKNFDNAQAEKNMSKGKGRASSDFQKILSEFNEVYDDSALKKWREGILNEQK